MRAIDGDRGPGFFAAIRPAHDDAFDPSRSPEAEVQPKIVLGIVAAAAANFLALFAVGGDDPHQGPDGAAVRLRADELHRHPMSFARLIQPQEIGRVVQVVELGLELGVVERGRGGV